MSSARFIRSMASVSQRIVSGISPAAAPSPATASIRAARGLTSLATPRLVPLSASPMFKAAAPLRGSVPPVAAANTDAGVATSPSGTQSMSSSSNAAAGVLEAGDDTLEALTSKGRSVRGHLVQPLDTEEAFNAFLSANRLVIVDFWATWCGPCKMISPELEKMAASNDYKGIAFCKVDVDEVEPVAAAMKISAMPTFLAFANGKQVGSTVGANKVKIHELAKDLLAKGKTAV